MKTVKVTIASLCGCFAWLLCGASPALASPINQVFLIQNSGWMLPLYDDPNSRFKELITDVAGRVHGHGAGETVVASFNQSVGEQKSPALIYKGADKAQLNAAFGSIQPARKPGKNTYTDTDFNEAIVQAIKQYTPGQPAIIWVVTNNKNSPDNSTETVERNKEFYRFLQNTPEIKRIVAFPFAMKVQSPSKSDYRANGLMFYGIAYGEPADHLLLQMLAGDTPFGKETARLKPLNAEALTFVPQGVKGADVKAQLGSDKKTLILTLGADTRAETIQLSGKLRNDFYPYDIKSAKISMTAGFSGSSGVAADLASTQLGEINAGALSPEITVNLTIPPIPSAWSPDIIFGDGKSVHGELRFNLNDQKLTVSRRFLGEMGSLFPNDPLPELFIPGESARQSVTIQPLMIRIEYPVGPLLILSLGGLILVGGVITGTVLLRKEKRYRVSVDGIQKNYALRRFNEVILKNNQGERIAVLKRGFGAPVALLDKGKTALIRIS